MCYFFFISTFNIFSILKVTEQKRQERAGQVKIINASYIFNIYYHLVLSTILQIGYHYYFLFIDWGIETKTTE